MAYETRPINSNKEIIEVIELYSAINDEEFMPVHKEYAYRNIWMHVKQKKFHRLYLEDNIIIGFIFCSPFQNYHFCGRLFAQEYFFTNAKGRKACNVIKILHNEMIKEAVRLKCNAVVSAGSHLDEDYTFTRILEKQGWLRRGHLAVKYLTPPMP